MDHRMVYPDYHGCYMYHMVELEFNEVLGLPQGRARIQWVLAPLHGGASLQ